VASGRAVNSAAILILWTRQVDGTQGGGYARRKILVIAIISSELRGLGTRLNGIVNIVAIVNIAYGGLYGVSLV
jgi:hypothetical protein